ncbi:MAG: ATP-dependent DNA helicase [Actinobacteria bacterium]|nr:ATP-dependent DNA helicase [Actinomycetota bacterium]
MTTDPAARATQALERVVDALDGGEPRPGQVEMAVAVAAACESGNPVIVQAGTGTGKSLAYLVPAVVLGKQVLVATATKALQDQLAAKDAPQVASVLGDFEVAVLKGRSNYVCHQKLDELRNEAGLFGDTAMIDAIAEWADESEAGEIAELEHRYEPAVLGKLVTGSDECNGPRCAMKDVCRANEARARADAAQVVIVNQHLLGADVDADGAVLPQWDVLVVDEAHELEDVMAHALGDDVGPGRIRRVLGAVVDLLADNDDLKRDVHDAADRFAAALDAIDLGPRELTRRYPHGLTGDDRLNPLITSLIERLNSTRASLGKAAGSPETAGRVERATKASSRLTTVLGRLLEPQPDDVVWVEGPPGKRRVKIASLGVAPRLARYWRDRPVVLTSATIPPGLGPKLALDAAPLQVASPFDYREQALFYVARHLPEPRDPGWRAAAAAETRRLVDAAGGRALLLFTSWNGLRETLDLAFTGDLPYRLLRQGDMGKHALIEAFHADETSVLAATRGFWAGIDVPGDPLRLVVIDRIPFPVPTEPLHQARGEAAGPSAFSRIDVPLAATYLAQGSGRLIRTRADRGVVALMDPRLALRRDGYGRDLQQCLPPMAKTVSLDEAIAFLHDLDPTTTLEPTDADGLRS